MNNTGNNCGMYKKLVERYPYLIPRNIFTDKIPDNYDYSYIIGLEIPDGWSQLFLQMCEDIRQPLIDADYLEKFRFSQVKEKFNQLRCYNFGAPKTVQEIIDKYSVISGYVCTMCGRPATCETRGYIASLCNECYEAYAKDADVELVEFRPTFVVERFENGEFTEQTISFADEWERYLELIYRI